MLFVSCKHCHCGLDLAFHSCMIGGAMWVLSLVAHATS